ncbi:hypothetical protein ABL78_5076 [Leptomonas seymouri]|uniref:Potassium channel tetramerisation-type BTB domain-containing protein n=1 Tax=Leptomonas seymouri TaxID=5684 RepID=A0A0N0P4Z1_LEPSE|nr:hypothetical protein ABL78_5076 [Leptomonas seymouri]|eukprot:KPI85856.1 hypothetical protein ABL78_5076 [Leptomonas seymouri]
MSAAVTWLQGSLGMDVTGEWARHIHLNVGGVLYTTRRHNLRNLHGHPIFGPILSGRAHKCEDGSFLIDGDSALFRYILQYLRSGTLSVPDTFDEWGMLLQEVRHYQLAELEQLVLNNFDYQSCMFKRQLPHGVYVWWPTVSGQEASHRPAPPLRQLGPSPLEVASARPAGKESGGANPPPAISATAADAPLSPPLPSSSSLFRIRIVPPLPGLEVDAATGVSVTFRSSQVLHDLDQLVTVLLNAYGYTIQHWDEACGRVLLSLPGSL